MKAYLPEHKKNIGRIWLICGSCFVGMVLIATFFEKLILSPVFAPLGSSAVMLYGAPHSPCSQPKNLVGGHIFSALIGVTIYKLLGDSIYAIALAIALSLLVMLLTGTIHPPAGATAILGLTTSQGNFFWVLMPVGAGAGLLLLIFLIYDRLTVFSKSS